MSPRSSHESTNSTNSLAGLPAGQPHPPTPHGSAATGGIKVPVQAWIEAKITDSELPEDATLMVQITSKPGHHPNYARIVFDMIACAIAKHPDWELLDKKQLVERLYKTRSPFQNFNRLESVKQIDLPEKRDYIEKFLQAAILEFVTSVDSFNIDNKFIVSVENEQDFITAFTVICNHNTAVNGKFEDLFNQFMQEYDQLQQTPSTQPRSRIQTFISPGPTSLTSSSSLPQAIPSTSSTNETPPSSEKINDKQDNDKRSWFCRLFCCCFPAKGSDGNEPLLSPSDDNNDRYGSTRPGNQV